VLVVETADATGLLKTVDLVPLIVVLVPPATFVVTVCVMSPRARLLATALLTVDLAVLTESVARIEMKPLPTALLTAL